MKFFSKLNQKFSQFMYGRYGTDSLNRFLICLWLIASILNLFLHSIILYLLGTIFCVVVLYRMFSKNFVKRRRENASWYEFTVKLKNSFRLLTVRFRDRKVAHFFKCPKCKAPIRMPKKVGKFNIRCAKCGNVFQKEFK